MAAIREEHPSSVKRSLPGWLRGVLPLEIRRTSVPLLERGKTVPAGMLVYALTMEAVGTTIRSLSIVPGLAEITQLTEKPNFPAEPTLVQKRDHETWAVCVGNYTEILDAQALEDRLREALFRSSENEDT